MRIYTKDLPFIIPIVIVILALFGAIGNVIYRAQTEERYYLKIGYDTCSNETAYVVIRNRVWERDYVRHVYSTLEEANEYICRYSKNRIRWEEK